MLVLSFPYQLALQLLFLLPTSPWAGSNGPAPAPPLPPPPATNERVYTGTIGPYPVVLNLQLSDTTNQVTARYHYLRRGTDLALTGRRWSDSLELGETPEPPYRQDYFEATAWLHARLHGDSLITGYWQAEGKRQRLPVKLRRRRQAYDYACAARLSPGYWLNGFYVQPVRFTDDAPALTNPDDPLADIYTDVRFPLVAGLANKRAEARLNDLLSGAQLTRWSSGVWTRTRLVPEKEYLWLNACYLEETSLELLTPELVSFSLESQQNGCGSPPYHVRHQYTVLALPALRPIPLAELLQGNYRALLRRYVRQAALRKVADAAVPAVSAGSEDRCNQAYILRSVEQTLAATSTTENMLLTTEGLLIHQPNLDNSCGGRDLNELEVLIPYAVLRPYVRPNSALSRALPAAGRKP